MTIIDPLPAQNKDWSEDRLQQECFQWAWNYFPEARRCFYHIPNERHFHNIVEAARYKAIGVIAGAHDMPLFWNGKLYYFEFKVRNDNYSKNQLKFADASEKQGAICILCRNLEFFQNCFRDIIYGQKQISVP